MENNKEARRAREKWFAVFGSYSHHFDNYFEAELYRKWHGSGWEIIHYREVIPEEQGLELARYTYMRERAEKAEADALRLRKALEDAFDSTIFMKYNLDDYDEAIQICEAILGRVKKVLEGEA